MLHDKLSSNGIQIILTRDFIWTNLEFYVPKNLIFHIEGLFH